MRWKTAALSHIHQICALGPLLIELLQICSNGLVPDVALRALHAKGQLEVQEPTLKTPKWEDAALAYLNLR